MIYLILLLLYMPVASCNCPLFYVNILRALILFAPTLVITPSSVFVHPCNIVMHATFVNASCKSPVSVRPIFVPPGYPVFAKWPRIQ